MQHTDLNKEFHAVVDRQVQKFLQDGGEIQMVPYGVSGLTQEGTTKGYSTYTASAKRKTNNDVYASFTH